MRYAFLFLAACGVEQQPINRCRVPLNQQPFAREIPAPSDASYPPLPASFQWGAATAAFQIESNITDSDWSHWDRIANGDSALDGPAHELHYREDIQRLVALGARHYRFSIEWSRVFPTRGAAPNPDAVAYYDDLIDALVAAGVTPMVTLQHFTLPDWIVGGIVSEELPVLMAEWAAFAARTWGDRVDLWITINEPSGVAAGGFADGSFPPGRLIDANGFTTAYARMIEAHARMYDAIALNDRTDADRDGVSALISFASHNKMYIPKTEADLDAARRVRWISNLVLIEAASCGHYDANFDETLEPGVDRIDDPTLKDRLDFLAINYYGTAEVSSIPIEPFRGLPQLVTTSSLPKTDFGWDIAPEALLAVLSELSGYRLPVIITENGVADRFDVMRPRFLVDSIRAVQTAVAQGFDVRGYYHWSLIDNFEWAHGFCPRLGLYEIDYATKARVARPSADVYRQIIEARGVPDALRNAYVYGTPTFCPPP